MIAPTQCGNIIRSATERSSPLLAPARAEARRGGAPGLAVVDELDGEVVVRLADEALDLLQVVAALAGDAQLIALNLRLDGLGSLIPDELGDLLGVLLADPVGDGHRDLGELARQRGLGR